jgi:hypothetical protein
MVKNRLEEKTKNIKVVDTTFLQGMNETIITT